MWNEYSLCLCPFLHNKHELAITGLHGRDKASKIDSQNNRLKD